VDARSAAVRKGAATTARMGGDDDTDDSAASRMQDVVDQYQSQYREASRRGGGW